MKLLIVALLTACAARLQATSDGHTCATYPCIIFEDDFNTLDFEKWQHEITAGGGGNNEFQYYSNNRANSFVRDGKLFIRPTLVEEEKGRDFIYSGTLDLWGASPSNLCTGNAWRGCYRKAGGGEIVNPVQSARLRSVHSFNYRYGRIEVEAKMPKGDWMWPAIWLLPKHNEYGEWPASGEIDLVEIRGNRNLTRPDGVYVGIQEAGMAMHWGPRYPYNGFPLTINATHNFTHNFAEHFHKYRIDWAHDEGFKFYIDDQLLLEVNPPRGFWELGRELFKEQNGGVEIDEKRWNAWKPEHGATRLAPFDKPFHIIMNVAIGGTNGYFFDELINQPYPKPWRNSDRDAAAKFYNAKHLWYPTWLDDDSRAMQVNYVRVWKLKPDP